MSGILPQQPTSIWKRPLKVDFSALAKALGKGAIAGSFGLWPGVAGSGVDVLSALGLKSNTVEAIAWLLVQRSLLQGMSELTVECKTDLKQEPDFTLLCEQLDHALKSIDLSLTPDFFKHPKRLPIVEQVQTPFRQWLRTYGLSVEQAQSLSDRLPRYFVFALNEQWRVHPTDYAPLQSALGGPFESANARELAWMRYSAWLQRRVDEPMFAEAFGLRQVYVPLRAYYERKVESPDSDDYAASSQTKARERCVVDLKAAIADWLAHQDKNDAIRLICGGPGCGKSSFGKMLAADLIEAQTLPVLFVPLHQFNASGDLVEALNAFLRTDLDGILPPNPLETDNAERQVLLIFDGLDELSMQGKIAAQVAQDFVREVQKKLLAFNRSETHVLALLSGRDLVVDGIKAEFRKEGQILYVLPYFQIEEALQKHTYVDEQKLLHTDQRDDWWQTYGILKGKSYKKLPAELNQDQKLIEITAQPLLNYLVALSYDRKEIDFSTESNLNVVYNDLLDQVYKRDWADYQHPALGNIKEKKDFVRILEEIAIACWHGNGRTTTITKIEARCNNSSLKRVLEIFEGGGQEGVTRLLTAFYFRQSGIQGSEAAFEFTHKSFGEYLTARRIVLELQIMQKQLTEHRNDPDTGRDEKECLKRWAILCGPTAIDDYLLSFLKDEVKQHPGEEVLRWQQTLCELIGYLLHYGMPMEEVNSCPKFNDKVVHSRNASEALLAALSSCAWMTKVVSNIKLPTSEAFGTWMMTLQGQRNDYNNNLTAFNCLNQLNLGLCNLFYRDLGRARLQGANLAGANLQRANLQRANLAEARLQGANLEEINLEDANLKGANLTDTSLKGANLQRANLGEANLQGTNLAWANLQKANLQKANLEDANLPRANLHRVNLQGMNLQRINLQAAKLEGANLQGANLQGTNLAWANLQRAYLAETNLQGINLQGANLRDTNLQGVNLCRANLYRANLQGANLQGANLQEANLKGADLKDIFWNAQTFWKGALGIETAINVPQALKIKLGLE